MTTEQKEAVALVKDFTKMDFNNPMGWTGYYDTELKELQQAIETVLNLIQEQEEELKKKDKQIDLMAKAFKQDDVRSVQEIKQYFERKVEN